MDQQEALTRSERPLVETGYRGCCTTSLNVNIHWTKFQHIAFCNQTEGSRSAIEEDLVCQALTEFGINGCLVRARQELGSKHTRDGIRVATVLEAELFTSLWRQLTGINTNADP